MLRVLLIAEMIVLLDSLGRAGLGTAPAAQDGRGDDGVGEGGRG